MKKLATKNNPAHQEDKRLAGNAILKNNARLLNRNNTANKESSGSAISNGVKSMLELPCPSRKHPQTMTRIRIIVKENAK